MNKYFKIVLLGILIWVVPFLTSFFVWDVNANAPSIGSDWFYALMTFVGAISFAIAICVYFSKIKHNSVSEGWTVGIIWYAELILLDLIFLVGLLSMSLIGYYHLLLTYLNVLIISVAIGYAKR